MAIRSKSLTKTKSNTSSLSALRKWQNQCKNNMKVYCKDSISLYHLSLSVSSMRNSYRSWFLAYRQSTLRIWGEIRIWLTFARMIKSLYGCFRFWRALIWVWGQPSSSLSQALQESHLRDLKHYKDSTEPRNSTSTNTTMSNIYQDHTHASINSIYLLTKLNKS